MARLQAGPCPYSCQKEAQCSWHRRAQGRCPALLLWLLPRRARLLSLGLKIRYLGGTALICTLPIGVYFAISNTVISFCRVPGWGAPEACGYLTEPGVTLVSLCCSDREAPGTAMVFGVHRCGHGIQGQGWASRPRHAQTHHPPFFIQTLALMAEQGSPSAACPCLLLVPTSLSAHGQRALSLLRCLPLTASGEETL